MIDEGEKYLVKFDSFRNLIRIPKILIALHDWVDPWKTITTINHVIALIRAGASFNIKIECQEVDLISIDNEDLKFEENGSCEYFNNVINKCRVDALLIGRDAIQPLANKVMVTLPPRERAQVQNVVGSILTGYRVPGTNRFIPMIIDGDSRYIRFVRFDQKREKSIEISTEQNG